MSNISIVIPTLNSERYIDIVLSYYRDLGVPVIVFVDNKTSDRTSQIASQYVDKVIQIENPSTRVGEMIEGMTKFCNTPWVLRLDDDELPSISMLRLISEVIVGYSHHVVGFNRFQCVFSQSGELFESMIHDAETHRQYRMYQPNKVKFHGRGHTSGFDFDFSHCLMAPSEAFMIHLDWVVHSREERLHKIARYDLHTPGHGTAFRDYYLADEKDGFKDQLRRLYAPEFYKVGKKLLIRFPEASVPISSARKVPPTIPQENKHM